MDNLKIKQVIRSLKDNKTYLTLEGKYTTQELNQEKLYSLQVMKTKRSVKANNYAWELIDQLAPLVGKGSWETYEDYLLQYSPSYMLSTPKSVHKQVLTKFRHYRIIGEREQNGVIWIDFLNIMGSSEYDSKQMARFLDAVVRDCKDQGIETRTPSELAKLKASWKGEKK